MVADTINVEVAYAEPGRQALISVELPAASTVGQAIETSRLADHFPDLNISNHNIGVFGVICKPDKILSEGDRVEIYRPLQQDPMNARRARARNS